MSTPRKLYKYRAFSANTVDQLCLDQMFFADPASFNDPLDTRPCIEPDCETDRLEQTLSQLVYARLHYEASAAAAKIRYQGPKTIAQIEKLAEHAASREVYNAKYHAGNPEHRGTPEEAYRWELVQRIERLLLEQYDKGVVSLAKRATCPLMWSHYADQHRGICIGYEVPKLGLESLHEISYGKSRTVSAKEVADMVLEGDEFAREKVDAAVLLNKAKDWRYEREYRLIGSKGLQEAPLHMTEVLFGMRCTNPVRYAVMKALGKRVKFFEIDTVRGTFNLKKKALDPSALFASYPVNAASNRAALEDLSQETTPPA